MSTRYTQTGIGGTVELSSGGAKVKNSAGVVQARNNADSAFARLQVADGTAADDAVTKRQLDNLAAGLQWKAPVVAATTAAITLATDVENGDTLDGVVLSTGDRVLVKDQGTAANGIYVVAASGAPARASDLGTGDGAANAAVFVSQGTVHADQAFTCTNDQGADIVGTDTLAFTLFASIAGIANPLIVGDGTGDAVIGVDYFNGGGNSGQFSFRDAGVERWRFRTGLANELDITRYNASGVLQGTSLWFDPADGSAAFEANLLLASASPVLSVGDGLGAPTFSLNKLDTAIAALAFLNEGTQRWQVEMQAAEDFAIGRYDAGGSFTNTPFTIDAATGNIVLTGKLAAHGAAIANGVSGADSLTVGAGTGAAGLTAFTSNAGIGSIQFTDATATRKGAIEYQQSLFTMTFAINGGSELVLSTGNLYPFADMGQSLGATNRFFLNTYTDRLLVDQAEAADAVTGAAQVIVGDGSVAAGVTIFTSATTAGQIAMTDAAGTNVGAWRYDHNSVRHEWDVEGVEEMTLSATALAPSATGGLALGSTGARWSDALLERGFFGGSTGTSPVAGADEGVFGDGVGDRGITLFAGAAAVAGVYFIDVAATANGWLKYDHANTRFDLGVEGASEVYLTAAALSPAADKGLNLGSATLQFDDVFAVALRLEEQASAPATAAAGEGIFWVDDAEATVPMFTDDADVSHKLAYSDAWQIVIRASDMYPDANNDPATATTDNQHKVMAFADNGGVSGPNGAIYEGIWPRGYRGNGVTVRVHYSANSAGGAGVTWLAAFENMTAQDIDSDGWSTEVSYDHSGPHATPGLIVIASFTMTDGAQIDSLAGGDAFRFRLRRDGDDANDTFANPANVHRVEITENV